MADLALIGVLDRPQAVGRRLDVGDDDVLSVNRMIEIVAGLLGRKPPPKVRLPRRLLRAIAPLAGRLAKLPPGAFPAFVEALDADSIGDPAPIRAMLPRRRLSFGEAAERAITGAGPTAHVHAH